MLSSRAVPSQEIGLARSYGENAAEVEVKVHHVGKAK